MASTAGGLGEVVLDGETGLSFAPGDVAGLAHAAGGGAGRPCGRRAPGPRRQGAAGTDFDWSSVAAGTAAVYAAAPAGGPVELGRPKIPTGNVFGR